MADRSALVAVSCAQLGAQLAGQVVALRRRQTFDVPLLHGDPAHVLRDSWWGGTAFSAPVFMLGTQTWATARLARNRDPDERARATLRLLGLVMVPGYLLERLGRRRLRPSGFEPVETPVVAAGLAGAVAMATLARSRR